MEVKKDAYPPLEAFRILTLWPSEDDQAEIRCSTKWYLIEDERLPSYTALSYTWGEKKTDDPVVNLNGRQISITENLSDALRQLRSQTHDTKWWIDQLCINQSDVVEKRDQVSKMKKIFASAQEVICWVGKDSRDFQELQELLANLPEERPGRSHRTTAMRRDEDELELVKRIPSRRPGPWIEEFFNRPYWSRVWVIEELVLAQKARIRCGEGEIDIRKLSRALEALSTHSRSSVSEISRRWLGIFRSKRSEIRYLHNVLLTSSGAKTKKEVDQIFGVLGMVTHGSGMEIIPDYTLTSCAVYCRAIKAIFKDLTSNENSQTSARIFQRLIRGQCAHDPFQEASESTSCTQGLSHFGRLFERADQMLRIQSLWIESQST